MITKTKKSSLPIGRDDIKMTDKDIILRYLGINQFPCKISSPLRDDDDTPSFCMQEKGDVILWKDFGTGDGGNAVSLMAKLWKVEYTEALLKIFNDSDNVIPQFSMTKKYNGKINIINSSSIKVKVREWQEYDVKFWKSFGISKKFATWCNVYPISHAFFTKEIDGVQRTSVIPMEKYAYAYFEWKDGKESIKLYQPFSTTIKWLSKHDASVWDLWRHAFEYADKKNVSTLIITSSRKDAMCLWNTLGIPAIAMQGEGYLPKDSVMKTIFNKFRRVYLWYDNDYTHTKDNPGQDNAQKLIDLYPQLKNICIPSSLQCKDPSDLYKKYGKEKLKQVWKEMK